LFLVRHGEVDANRQFLFLGRRDDPLNRRGRRQAAALAETIGEIPVDLVLSSPLQRTTATAQPIASAVGCSVHTDRRLLELDFGTWEGLSRHDIARRSSEDARNLEAWEKDPSRPTPNGESLATLQRRVISLADQLASERPGETVVVVSHMGPVKSLLCAALELPLISSWRVFLDPATITVIDWGTRPVVRLVNSHAHLGFANARWLPGEAERSRGSAT
jgi:broad specificity phosphatase PhoE